ncbi:MAG: hypothetical protein AA908_04870 [Chlorobi bacterium NICIL-2]|nr:MAG: hypothetical protein AA908_04870 [Chlorobi bacterium NICIL-2]
MRACIVWTFIVFLSIAVVESSGQILKKVRWSTSADAVKKLKTVQDATGRWWWIRTFGGDYEPKDSLYSRVLRQVGEPTPTFPDVLDGEWMVGKALPYGFRYGFNERARKFDFRYDPPYMARDKRRRVPYWSYTDVASSGDLVIAVGPRVDRFSVSQNRWLEPLDYWESDTAAQPTLRYFTDVEVTPRGVYVAAHAEYIHPSDYKLDQFWFELYRVESDRLEPVLRRRSWASDEFSAFSFTRDGSKLVLWLDKDLITSPDPSTPEIVDMETGQSVVVQIPWSEIVEDITWFPIPHAAIADCDERYVYFINDRVGRTKSNPAMPDPSNYVIIRYDLQLQRIDAIAEPRQTPPRWVALLGEKLFVSTVTYSQLEPDKLEAIHSWRPWPSGGYTPRQEIPMNDSLRFELSYLVGLTCGSPAMVSNQNGRVYVMDVARLLDTTSTVNSSVDSGELVVLPNPVVGSHVLLRGVDHIVQVWLWDTRGRRLPVQWNADPVEGGTVALEGVANGLYRIEVITERGTRWFEPLVVLR